MSDLPTQPGGAHLREQRPTSVAAVLGSSGFVGRAVADSLASRGVAVRRIAAPRLTWPRAEAARLEPVPVARYRAVVDDLVQELEDVDVVINAAGLPDGCAPATPQLYGANALLPALVAQATTLAGARRFIHVSSAAAQGSGSLDESPNTAPFSPYSESKALGERLLLREFVPDRVIYRSTWVHGVGRPNTTALIRLARSPLSCVAGDGSAPTPQVLIGDVAAALTHLGLTPGPIPPIVLQPPTGMTTGLLLRLLGGREPRHLPQHAAQAATRCLATYARCGLRANSHVRRLEMLLFGKDQDPGWLARQGLAPTLRRQEWERLAAAD